MSASTVSAADMVERPGPSIAMAPLAEGAAPSAPTGTVEIFVRLDDPSIAAFSIASMKRGDGMPSPEEQKAHAAKLDQAQAAVRAQLAGMGAEAMSSMRAGDNGFRVRVDASQQVGQGEEVHHRHHHPSLVEEEGGVHLPQGVRT